MSETIISQRECSGPSSTWDEYLVLRCEDGQRFTLFTGKFELLAEANAYWCDQTEEYHLPSEIAGKSVLWVKDGYIVGGDLDFETEDQSLSFEGLSGETIHAWLVNSGWLEEISLQEVISKIQEQSRLT